MCNNNVVPPENQRIASLVDYLKQNSSVQVEALKSASIAAGYTEAEFVEAQAIISGHQNQATVPPTIAKKGLPLKIIIALILLILILVAGVVGYFLLFKNNTLTTKTASLKSPEITPEILSPEKGNLFENFSAYLKSKNLKITVSGSLENKNRANLIALELEGEIFYLKKGELVRLDAFVNECTDSNCDGPRSKKEITKLLLPDGVYVLLPEKKLFQNTTKPIAALGLPINDVLIDLKYSFPLFQLIESKPDWQQLKEPKLIQSDWRQTGKQEWESETIFRFNEIETVNRDPISSKVVFSHNYETVESLSIKYSEEASWQTLNFTYENIDNLDNLLTIPKDYTELKEESN